MFASQFDPLGINTSAISMIAHDSFIGQVVGVQSRKSSFRCGRLHLLWKFSCPTLSWKRLCDRETFRARCSSLDLVLNGNGEIWKTLHTPQCRMSQKRKRKRCMPSKATIASRSDNGCQSSMLVCKEMSYCNKSYSRNAHIWLKSSLIFMMIGENALIYD